jgi:hypothetical protein
MRGRKWERKGRAGGSAWEERRGAGEGILCIKYMCMDCLYERTKGKKALI